MIKRIAAIALLWLILCNVTFSNEPNGIHVALFKSDTCRYCGPTEQQLYTEQFKNFQSQNISKVWILNISKSQNAINAQRHYKMGNMLPSILVFRYNSNDIPKITVLDRIIGYHTSDKIINKIKSHIHTKLELKL